jgi:uncharacterized membrane protein
MAVRPVLTRILALLSALALASILIPLFFAPLAGLDNLRYPLLAFASFHLLASWAGEGRWLSSRLERALESRAFPYALFFLAAVAFIRIKLLQLPAGQISGADFSHIDYAIWSTAQGRFMEIPFLPTMETFTDFFGNHYSPVLFIHVLARFVSDTPLSSLVVHALSLAAAIPVLYALAVRLTDRVSASFLTLNYALCGAVASTLQFDIHQESFYPLAFGLIFLGLYSSRWLLAVGTILAFSVKEDAGLYLFPAFLLLSFLFPQKRKLCVFLSALSLGWLIVVLKLLMPMHQPDSAAAPYYLPMWARYGGTFREVAWQMATHPHQVAWDLLSNKDLYKNLLQWGGLPALSPLGAIALPPALVSSTASGVQRALGLYYGIVLVPVFFFASAHFLANRKRRRELAALALALGAFVGGSYLRFPKPLSFKGEVHLAANTLSQLEGEVFVQSGLLPFLPYQVNWRRIDKLDQVPARPGTTVALFEGLSVWPLDLGPAALGAALATRGFELKESSGRLKLYQLAK